MTEDYISLLDYLTNTTMRWLLPGERWDCDEPEDPEWSSPQDHPNIQALLRRLPIFAAFVCQLTAAEMVLPIWEKFVETHVVRADISVIPYSAIEIGEGYLRELYQAWEVKRVGDVAGSLTGATHGPILYGTTGWFAMAAVRLNPLNQHGMGFTVHDAARAYAGTQEENHIAEAEEHCRNITRYRERCISDIRSRAYMRDYHSFLKRWWQICRCRLAFRTDVEYID